MHSPPYHPQSNGLGERGVQTVKRTLKKFLIENNKLSLDQQIVKFLFSYRNTQSTVTGSTPNDLIFKYKTKTSLDAINPRPQENFQKSLVSVNKKESIITHKMEKESFEKNERIWYRNHFKDYTKWLPATFMKKISQNTYLISLNGVIRMVHKNQFRKENLNDKYPSGEKIINKHFVPTEYNSELKRRWKRARSESVSPQIPRRSKRIKSQHKINYKM